MSDSFSFAVYFENHSLSLAAEGILKFNFVLQIWKKFYFLVSFKFKSKLFYCFEMGRTSLAN